MLQDTVLHIVCPNNVQQDAFAIDGNEVQNFADRLTSDAMIQGVRVAKRKQLLSTSTLYRFLGPVNSWDPFRGVAVVEVNQQTRGWDSVVGLHSFEYLNNTEGHR
jgi:hypothetical protein